MLSAGAFAWGLPTVARRAKVGASEWGVGARQLQFPYHPHVTVAHLPDDVLLDRAFEGLAAFDCAFTVDAFHLYVHDPDLGWKATRDYPLTGDIG